MGEEFCDSDVTGWSEMELIQGRRQKTGKRVKGTCKFQSKWNYLLKGHCHLVLVSLFVSIMVELC